MRSKDFEVPRGLPGRHFFGARRVEKSGYPPSHKKNKEN